MPSMKITRDQEALLRAVKEGATIYYIEESFVHMPSAHYFLSSTMRRCTMQVRALVKKNFLMHQQEVGAGMTCRLTTVAKEWLKCH